MGLPDKEASAPRISVIIAAHDEEAYLPETLAAVGRQTVGDIETIVVANACTDRTAEIGARRARVIRLAEAGVCRARNVGARAATGRLLVFLDADVLLSPRALEAAEAAFREGGAVGTFRARPSGPHLWCRILFILKNLIYRAGIYRSTWGVLVCPRQLFLRVGGFDETLHLREHRELARRLLRNGGYRFVEERVTVSTRRYERWGVFRFCSFWLVSTLGGLLTGSRGEEYDVVR